VQIFWGKLARIPVKVFFGGVILMKSDLESRSDRKRRVIVEGPPACSFRSRSKYVVKKGKTPVWSREDAKTLLDSIPKDSVSGLRDLALIAAMFYSFARVSAVLKLNVDDYYHNGVRRAETA
jgi:hypothetical protein